MCASAAAGATAAVESTVVSRTPTKRALMVRTLPFDHGITDTTGSRCSTRPCLRDCCRVLKVGLDICGIRIKLLLDRLDIEAVHRCRNAVGIVLDRAVD